MANPATLITSGTFPATLLADGFVRNILVESDRAYSISHDGENENGTTNTSTIIISCFNDKHGTDDTFPNNAGGPRANKVKLVNLRTATVGPGFNMLRFQCLSGSCTFAVVPSEKFYHRF